MKLINIPAIVLLFGANFSMAQGTLDSGLIRNYPFSGNAYDASVTGDNATVTGATLTTDRFGTANSAYLFDGINDRVNFSPTGCTLQEFTYSIWANIRTDSFQTSAVGVYALMYIGNAAYHDHGITTGGNSEWTIGSYHSDGTMNNVLSNVVPVTDVWQHLVFTRDDDSIKLYLNGQKLGATSVGGKSAGWSGTHHAVIGARPNYYLFFRGALDEARVYNRALSSTEVSDLYNTQSTAPTSVKSLVKLDAELFPNPIRPGMVLTVNSEIDFGNDAQIHLYTASGNEIYHGNFVGSLEIPQVADGIYFVVIRSSKGILSKKLQITSN